MDIVTKRITLWMNVKIPINTKMTVPDWLADAMQKRGQVEIIAPDIIEQEAATAAKSKTKKGR